MQPCNALMFNTNAVQHHQRADNLQHGTDIGLLGSTKLAILAIVSDSRRH